MNNPNGPYPGRQLFLGVTKQNSLVLAYLITGRSPESRERRAVLVDNVIRIGPLGNQPYDPLRHYAAVKIDDLSGIVAVSNGIQTDAIFEVYKLLFNTGSKPGKEYMEQILEAAGAEPDSYHTPRIAGIVTFAPNDKSHPILIIGMKANKLPAKAIILEVEPGMLAGISTYRGSLDSPEARNPADLLAKVDIMSEKETEIAQLIFDISAANYKGNDIRVSSVGGVRAKGRDWQFSIINVQK